MTVHIFIGCESDSEMSAGTRLDHVEAPSRINRSQIKTALLEQVAVLPLGALAPAGPAKHVQVAHRMRLVLLRVGWRLRHQPFDQQKLAITRERLATIPQDQ